MYTNRYALVNSYGHNMHNMARGMRYKLFVSSVMFATCYAVVSLWSPTMGRYQDRTQTAFSSDRRIPETIAKVDIHSHMTGTVNHINIQSKDLTQVHFVEVAKRSDECGQDTLDYLTNTSYVCYRPLSRLGNQMFLFASAYGIASRLNKSLIIGDAQIAALFNVSAKIISNYKCVIDRAKVKYSKRNSAFDVSMFEPRGDNVRVGKHLQSYKYFQHVADDIRREMTFRKEVKDKAEVIVNRAIKTYKQRKTRKDIRFRPVLVGVHVRRGDMVNHKFGFNVATPDYMKKAMTYFRSRYKHVLFLVCSNDQSWCKKNVVGDDVIYVTGNHYSVDMAVLVSCDHSLTTVGTFSWWAGFLTRGETVYYQWPAREGSPLRREFSQNYTDYFPADWIGMGG